MRGVCVRVCVCVSYFNYFLHGSINLWINCFGFSRLPVADFFFLCSGKKKYSTAGAGSANAKGVLPNSFAESKQELALALWNAPFLMLPRGFYREAVCTSHYNEICLHQNNNEKASPSVAGWMDYSVDIQRFEVIYWCHSNVLVSYLMPVQVSEEVINTERGHLVTWWHWRSIMIFKKIKTRLRPTYILLRTH